MKKFISLALVLLLTVAMAVPVFAAGGINENEQKVLDLLSQSVTVDGQQYVIPADYVNQAENYFNTIDMTAQEADEITGYIQDGIDYFIASGAKDITGLTYEEKLYILDCGKKAVAVLGMTLTADFVDNTVTILAPDGTVAFSAPATIPRLSRLLRHSRVPAAAATSRAAVRLSPPVWRPTLQLLSCFLL